MAVVEAMLHFMYHLDYNTIHGASTMIFNTQVYGLADKYIIPALKSLALEKVSEGYQQRLGDGRFPFGGFRGIQLDSGNRSSSSRPGCGNFHRKHKQAS